jgi:hypothetical protein
MKYRPIAYLAVLLAFSMLLPVRGLQGDRRAPAAMRDSVSRYFNAPPFLRESERRVYAPYQPLPSYPRPVEEGRVILKLRRGLDAGALARVERSIENLHRTAPIVPRPLMFHPENRLFLAKLRDRAGVAASVAMLRRLPEVEFAEEDRLLHLDFAKVRRPVTWPNDTRASEQWYSHTTFFITSPNGIHVSKLWHEGVRGSASTIVAVVDTGVDYEHPDLAPNIYRNPVESAAGALPGVDDDGNKYIDDVRGWNFLGRNNDPMDDHHHGTHVAGIIGAVGDNRQGIAGAAWKVSILPIKSFDANGTAFMSNSIAGISYAIERGAKIVNLSWGSNFYDQGLYDVLKRAQEKGVLIVAAAGNSYTNSDITPYYPAGYDLDNIISVGASDKHGDYAAFANWGETTVDVVAPGKQILSTVPDRKYDYLDGTSMAAPMVSGVAALVWSGHPELTYAQVRDRIIKCSTYRKEFEKRAVSSGLLNAYNAYHAKDCRK